MKKFFSILCALAIVLSVSAAPLKKAGRNLKKAPKKELRQANPFASFDKKMAKTANFKVSESLKKSDIRRAPKALAEAIDVTIGSWAIEDWGTDGELYLYAEDNKTVFYFDVIYGGEAEDLQPGKTYTVEDIYVGSEGQYAGVFYDGDWNYGIKELALTKTIDEAGLVHFVGSVTDSLDASFTFHYDEDPFVPTGDTIRFAIEANAKLSYSSYWEDWTVKADDGKYAIQLDILSENAESLVGEYASEDFDLDYTWVEIYTAPDSSLQIDAHEAAAVVYQSGDSLLINATILAEDGNVYEAALYYLAPKKEGEATITATNLVVDGSYYEWFGVVLAYASNEDFADIYFSLSPAGESYFGTYTIGADASGELLTKDSVDIDIYSGEITLAETADGIALTGKVLAYNNIEYALNLTYVKPDKTREEALTIEGLELAVYEGAWQVSGYNADRSRYISIAAYADQVAGTYTAADLAANYTVVYYLKNDTAYNGFSLVDANLVVTYDEATGVATVKGTLLGQGMVDATDVPEFTLDLTASAPEPSPYLDYDTPDKAFKEVFDSYEVSDKYLAQYGDLIVTATNENGARVGLDIFIAEGDSTLTPGEYSFAQTEEPFTVYIGQCDGSSVYYSFCGYTNAEGYITDLWFPVDGKLTVLENGVIELKAVNSYGAQVECRIGSWPEAIDNTDAKAAAIKRLVNGQLVIEKNGVKYNAIGTIVK